MAGEDARVKAGLKAAEDELNLIKNQIQQTLLDIREHILDVTNPFNSVDAGLLDDDEEIIEEGGLGGGGGSDAGESIESGGAEGDSESIEDLPEDELPPEEESLLDEDGDGFGDEFEEEVPEDELLGGGGDSGSLSDLLEPEDELEEEPEEDFLLDEEEEQPEALEEDEELEDELPQDSDMRDDGYEQPADGVGQAIAAALGANVDLLTLASLVRWTAVTRDRLGANRLDILLDAYEMAGRISPQMKNVIKTLSALGDEEGDGSIPVRDVVTAMVRMEGVLNSGPARESNRLLGLLLEIDDDPLDRLVA